jgi:hypothetical protein
MSIGVSTSTKPWRSMARADRAVDRGPDPQVALHALAPDVEVAVRRRDPLATCRPLVDRERRRLGGVEHLDLAVLDLDLAGRQLVVDVLPRAGGDRAGDAHDVLGAHVDRVVDHALGDAGVVAEVDEGERSPCSRRVATQPAQGDGLADVVGRSSPH